MTFFCPTEPQIRDQILALLPRGRAWQTNEGGPIKGWEPAFDANSFNPNAFQTTRRKFSVLWQYWAAFASVVYFLHQRLCALRMEFWCATKTETLDQWMVEYGLPDACDPFPDLCTKVSALGGTRCEYYAAVAARGGWSIECFYGRWCGTLPGQAGAMAGRFQPGRRGFAQMFIRVDLANSPAYQGPLGPEAPRCFTLRAGRPLRCPPDPFNPDISALECLMARVVHAEIQIVYEAITS